MSSSSNSILLTNGTVLSHVPSDSTPSGYKVNILRKHSLLIQDKKIAKIAKKIDAPAGARVIDCTDKIISPGFIDTHHHVWQSALKGRHADQLLIEYMPSGNMQCYNFGDAELFWSQLAGCLEAVDGGTTTVVDYAHMNYTPHHSPAAIKATVCSGIRSIFGYTPTPRFKSLNPMVPEPNLLEPWVMEKFEELAKGGPYGDGRVQLGFAYDGWWLPKEVIVGVFNKVRSLGCKLITAHYHNSPLTGYDSYIKKMADWGLLGPDVLFAHGNQPLEHDSQLLAKHGGSISSTPDTELQMALGTPICFNPEFYRFSSLGIDCHSNNSADILSQMRLGLQAARGIYNQERIDQKKIPRKVNYTVEDAFNLGTILGAKAIGMENEVGSLAEGKLADILIIDAVSPATAIAADENPIAAIVLHASTRDIETVIVNGQIRKENGKLLPVLVDGQVNNLYSEEQPKEFDWRGVLIMLRESHRRVEELLAEQKLDYKGMEAGLKRAWHADENAFVD